MQSLKHSHVSINKDDGDTSDDDDASDSIFY